MLEDHLAHELVVGVEGSLHELRGDLPQGRRVLHVREHPRYRPRRWRNVIRGPQTRPEGGRVCLVCVPLVSPPLLPLRGFLPLPLSLHILVLVQGPHSSDPLGAQTLHVVGHGGVVDHQLGEGLGEFLQLVVPLLLPVSGGGDRRGCGSH